MNFLKEYKNDEKLGIFLFLLSILFIIFLTYIGFTKLGMWIDEIFTLYTVKLPLNEIMDSIIPDVHPPLYYFIYKGLIKILSPLHLNIIIIGKLVSLIPAYLLLLLAATKVRKNFGWLTCGIFALTIITMPQLMTFYVELRMYSWGLFFITASLLYIYEILQGKSDKKHWIILTLLTICSAYTHYYSGICSFLIYLFLIIFFLKENKKEIKKWIISTTVSLISFLPWISIVINQTNNIKDNYWIAPITLNRVIGYIFFIFSPKNEVIYNNQVTSFSIISILLTISLLLLIIKFFKDKNKTLEKRFGIYLISIFIGVPLIGIIISLLIRPFFHPRYFLPALGCLWLGISILLAKNYNKKQIFIPILCLILICGIITTINFEQQQTLDQIEDNNIQQNYSLLGNKGIILYDHFQEYFQASSYYLNENYDYMDIRCQNTSDLYEKINDITQDPSIQNKINQNMTLYYIHLKNFNEPIKTIHENYTLEKKSINIPKAEVYQVIPK